MSNLPQTMVAGASAPLAGDVAALAQLAFAASAPGATVFGSGLDPFGPPRGVSAEALDLDLSDPLQRRFGDYELEAKLGQGGMGVVYRARQRSLDREVAIKLLAAGPWASRGFVERFRLEAQSAARMQHPNIVTIHEIGEQDGLPFFSMRLVRGRSLAETIQREGALAPRPAASLLRTVAEAVDYAHRLGVLHLDIKPGNVLLEESGEPLVADFGLARRLEETLEGSEEVSGTPSYMAPEQVAGGALGVATDVYALGATLYETLTARPPFRGATARETLEQVIAGGAPVPRSFDDRIPLDLQAICMRCLHKDPAQRYADARSLAEDLGRYLEGREVKARPLNRWQRAERMVRREPRLSALVAMVVVSLLAGLLATTVQWNRADANAANALEHLWTNRTQAAEVALADGDGFRGLRAMVDNLVEMEAAGRDQLAAVERQRIGILLASAPQLLRQVPLQAGASVSSVAISPDGQRFALAAHLPGGKRFFAQFRMADGALEWTTDNPGRQLTPFREIPHGLMRYSVDGRHILVGLMQQPVFAAPSHHDMLVLRSADGKLLETPEADARQSDAIWSDDASLALVRFLADPSRRFPETVRVYATEGWRPLGPERPHAAVQWLFTPDNKGLLGTGDGLSFELLDPVTFAVRWTLRLGPGLETMAWAFTRDSRWLALGANDGSVHLVEVATGRLHPLPSAPTTTIRWVEFDPDGKTLVAFSDEGLAIVWDLATRRPRTSPIVVGGAPENGRARLTSDVLITRVGDDLRWWGLPPRSPFENVARPGAARLSSSRGLWGYAFDLDPQGRRLVLGGRDAMVSIWQWPRSPILRARAAPLASGALQFDGRRVVETTGAEVRVFDIETESSLPWVAVHPEPVRFAEFSAGERWIVTLAGRSLRILDPATGELHGDPLVLPQTPLRVQLALKAQVAVLTTLEYVGDSLEEIVWAVDLDAAQFREQQPRAPGPLQEFTVDPLGRFVVLSSGWMRQDRVLDQMVPIAAEAPLCTLDAAQEKQNGARVAIDDYGRWLWTLHVQPGRQINVRAIALADCTLRADIMRPSASAMPEARAIGEQLVVHRLGMDELVVLGLDGSERRIPTLSSLKLMKDFDVSGDGRLVVQATRDAVQVFDLRRGARLSSSLAAPIAGNDAIGDLAIGSDGSRLLARTVQGRWLSWDLGLATAKGTELSALADRLVGTAPSAGPVMTAVRGGASGGIDQVSRSRLMRQVELAPAPGVRPDPRFWPLDLRDVINVKLDGSWPARVSMNGDILTLGSGRHRLLGVDWRIDGGVQLSGGGPASVLHPEQPLSGWVGFPAASARRLHLLMLHHIPMRPGDPPRVAARVRVRDAQGEERDLDIYSQRHVLTQSMIDAAKGSARVAWAGVFPAAVRFGSAALNDFVGGAFMVSLDIPPELGEIDGLRFSIGEGPMEAPLFYAATLELDQSSGNPEP
jgi:WD40 repeat protein